jgi:hypothetical protein
MKRRVFLFVLFFGLGLAACQFNTLSPQATPESMPTALVLPSETFSVPQYQSHPLPTSASTPSPVFSATPHPIVTAYSINAQVPTASTPEFGPTLVEYIPVTITIPPTPTSLTRVPTRTGKYTGRAKGIELDEKTGAVDQTKLKVDFGIVYGNEGWLDPVPNYRTNALTFYRANIPCLVLWDIQLPPDFDASRPERSFPPEAEEPNVAAIIKATKNKSISGVIARFVDKDMPDGRVFTQVWMAHYVEWMMNAIQHQTKKPTYFMSTRDFINGFGYAPELNWAVSKIENIASFNSAFPGQEPQLASWDDFPFPDDDYVPEYLGDNDGIDFINYSRSAWKFDGIDDKSTPLWIYKGSLEDLKKDLNYVDHEVIAP